MNGKPQDFMSVGMIHFMAFPEAMKPGAPVVESLRKLCADDYFSVVEVTTVKDAELRKRAIEVTQTSGRAVLFGAQPVLLGGKLNLNALEPRERQKAVDAVRACIAEAVEWKAQGLAVLSGPMPAPQHRDLAKSFLIASLKELCEVSRRLNGPPIRLETFDSVPYGKNCLIGPTAEAADLADKVAAFYPSFGLTLDLSHLPLLNETAAQAIPAAEGILKHVHIGNCVMRDPAHPAYGDNHPTFGCPGGENDVKELTAFLKALLDAGYIGQGKKNVVSFEIKPYGGQSADEVIANAKKTLDAAWATL
jgi:sugar phosphate isomerase/epimerase